MTYTFLRIYRVLPEALQKKAGKKMEAKLDDLIKKLLEQMQQETALTEEESERLKKEIEERLIYWRYIHE